FRRVFDTHGRYGETRYDWYPSRFRIRPHSACPRVVARTWPLALRCLHRRRWRDLYRCGLRHGEANEHWLPATDATDSGFFVSAVYGGPSRSHTGARHDTPTCSNPTISQRLSLHPNHRI